MRESCAGCLSLSPLITKRFACIAGLPCPCCTQLSFPPSLLHTVSWPRCTQLSLSPTESVMAKIYVTLPSSLSLTHSVMAKMYTTLPLSYTECHGQDVCNSPFLPHTQCHGQDVHNSPSLLHSVMAKMYATLPSSLSLSYIECNGQDVHNSPSLSYRVSWPRCTQLSLPPFLLHKSVMAKMCTTLPPPLSLSSDTAKMYTPRVTAKMYTNPCYSQDVHTPVLRPRCTHTPIRPSRAVARLHTQLPPTQHETICI